MLCLKNEDEEDDDEDLSDDDLRIKSGVGRDMYDEDDDENDDEDDETIRFQLTMMRRLAKILAADMCMTMGENDHDYDIARLVD
jgi:hypothetical protein